MRIFLRIFTHIRKCAAHFARFCAILRDRFPCSFSRQKNWRLAVINFSGVVEWPELDEARPRLVHGMSRTPSNAASRRRHRPRLPEQAHSLGGIAAHAFDFPAGIQQRGTANASHRVARTGPAKPAASFDFLAQFNSDHFLAPPPNHSANADRPVRKSSSSIAPAIHWSRSTTWATAALAGPPAWVSAARLAR